MNLTDSVTYLRTLSVSVTLDEQDIEALAVVLDTIERSPIVVVNHELPLPPTPRQPTPAAGPTLA